MARVTMGLAKCKHCKRYSQFWLCNGVQTTDYCQLCEPEVKAEKIDNAIRLLLENNVTPKMFEKLRKAVRGKCE